MVIYETIYRDYDGQPFQKAYSDQGFLIENPQGDRYAEVIDPIDSGRRYVETDEKIELPKEPMEEPDAE